MSIKRLLERDEAKKEPAERTDSERWQRFPENISRQCRIQTKPRRPWSRAEVAVALDRSASLKAEEGDGVEQPKWMPMLTRATSLNERDDFFLPIIVR